MKTDWAAKAMRGELGDTGPEARITWEALGAVYRSEPAPSRYGRDPAGDFSEAEPIVVTEEMIDWKQEATLRHMAIQRIATERDAALARAEVAETELAALWMEYHDLAVEQRLAALEPMPEPAHDPFREFPSDRRRVGG